VILTLGSVLFRWQHPQATQLAGRLEAECLTAASWPTRETARTTTTPAPAEVLARARRIGDTCAAYGVPAGAAALRLTLRHPAVTARD
jgi:hypothetical protein